MWKERGESGEPFSEQDQKVSNSLPKQSSIAGCSNGGQTPLPKATIIPMPTSIFTHKLSVVLTEAC